MKILVVTQYFWPEEFRINDICDGLSEDDYEIDVLTGLPNYPYGKYYDGYSILKKGEKTYKNNINIKRVPIIPRGKSNLSLILNYLSFMILGSLYSIGLLKNKYDKVFVFQLSPITLAIPGIIVSKIKKISSVIYVQDVWPESFYSIKKINNRILKKYFQKFCNYIYKSFDKVLITSKGFENILINKGVNKEKIHYLPQWAEDFYAINKFNIKDVENKKFMVTFAGNIGKAQSVNTIIEAANLAKKNKEIVWRIIGDGSEFHNIKKLVEKYSLSETVELLGRKPVTDMPKYFSESDGLIVTLKNEEILNVTLPAKVQSYMASGKPIIAAISGEGNRIIEESNSGLVGEAEDYISLYNNVINLYNLDLSEREKLGYNGLKFFENNFTRKKLLEKLKIIMNLQ